MIGDRPPDNYVGRHQLYSNPCWTSPWDLYQGAIIKTRLDPLDIFDVRSELTDDECMVKDSVARFVDEQVIPLMQEAFEQHRFPSELVPQVASLGLLGSSIEGYDCAGLNSISYGLICQELERGDSGLRSFVSVQSSLVMFPISAFGSEEQKQRWLPAMARGEAIGCFGLTEPQGGSDPNNMKTHAKRDGDDWILNGAKMWITNGTIADLAVVWAETDEGIKGFIVEKNMPGFTAQEIENKFSLRASITARVVRVRCLFCSPTVPAAYGSAEIPCEISSALPGNYSTIHITHQMVPIQWARPESRGF